MWKTYFKNELWNISYQLEQISAYHVRVIIYNLWKYNFLSRLKYVPFVTYFTYFQLLFQSQVVIVFVKSFIVLALDVHNIIYPGKRLVTDK
jgi:hypothetical protein